VVARRVVRMLQLAYRGGWRLVFVAIAIAALVLGYVGFSAHLGPNGEYSDHPLDLAYYDLQLFVLGAPPLDNGGDFPLTLQIARFAAPAVTVYALIQAARALFAAQIMRFRTRHLRRHPIVCGDSLIADALIDRLVQQHDHVVVVRTAPGPPRPGVLAVAGSPTSADVLTDAGIEHAAVLYVCTEDGGQNLNIADLAGQLRGGGAVPLHVHVQVDDPELCLALQARQLGRSTADGAEVSFYSPDELAARRLLERHPPPSGDGTRPPTVMVVGASWFAMALIVELARHWRLEGLDAYGRLPVALVDERARDLDERLSRLYPFIREACEFTAYEADVAELLDGDLPGESPDRVYLCCEQDAVSLKLALTMDQFWRRGTQSVVVCLRQTGRLGAVFDATRPDPLLDDVSGAITFFDAVQTGSDPRLIEDSLIERLARAVHEHYFLEQQRLGVPVGATPAMRPWSELDDDLKAANRHQATHVGAKLRAVGCALAPNPIWRDPETFDRSTVTHLAEMEHERWSDWMDRRGWTYGPARDEARKLHPDLVDWTELDDETKQKDVRAVTTLPAILSDAGFQIVRIGTPAPAPAAPQP
jgi:voltage-gated potassium channel Kch